MAMNRGESRKALARILLERDPGAGRIRKRTRSIGRRLLRTLPCIHEPNCKAIHPADLSFLFAAYDARFLGGICGRLLGPDGVAAAIQT